MINDQLEVEGEMMYYQAIFKLEPCDKTGTHLQVYVPGIKVNENFFENKIAKGEIRIDDGRQISAAQRGLIYSVFNDIRLWQGESHKRIGVAKVKLKLKADFCVESNIPMFSLSNVSMAIASEFIDYVLDFTFMNDISLTLKPFEISKTVRNWSYLCFKRRKCTVCCKSSAVVHHLDAVGIGRDRDKVDHSKMQLIMLCPEHHAEVHNIGDKTFMNKYYVAGIFVPIATLKALNIKGEYGEEANVGVIEDVEMDSTI